MSFDIHVAVWGRKPCIQQRPSPVPANLDMHEEKFKHVRKHVRFEIMKFIGKRSVFMGIFFRSPDLRGSGPEQADTL